MKSKQSEIKKKKTEKSETEVINLQKRNQKRKLKSINNNKTNY